MSWKKKNQFSGITRERLYLPIEIEIIEVKAHDDVLQVEIMLNVKQFYDNFRLEQLLGYVADLSLHVM